MNIYDAMVKGINSFNIKDFSWKIGPSGNKLKLFAQSVSNSNLIEKKEARVANIDVKIELFQFKV